jgi:lipopolysaccharide export LptBFGC system permease protein LptF
MFISSYNTFVHTNASQTHQKERVEKAKASNNTFASKLLQNEVIQSKNTQDIPITYISNYKAFSNKQKLYNSFEDENREKYTNIKSIKNAKIAYEDNSKMFSLFLEPKTTQSQTPKIDENLPFMRHKMVNTYLENDRYYKITA